MIKWYVDVAFAIDPDFKSHTGGVMTFGQGGVQNISQKQKLNTKSSTDAKLVAADDVSVIIFWTKLFLEAQGYEVEKNILFQDNKSAILLEENGRKSAGKPTKWSEETSRSDTVQPMRCGETSTASRCKARGSETSERRFWVRSMSAREADADLQDWTNDRFRWIVTGMDHFAIRGACV